MSTTWIPLLVPADRYTDYASKVIADARERGLLENGPAVHISPTGGRRHAGPVHQPGA